MTLGIHNVHDQIRINDRRRLAAWVPFVILALAMVYVMDSAAPKGFPLASTILLLGVGAIMYRPVIGVYFVAFFAFAGDSAVYPSYPFIKNLSSSESMLYIGNGLSLSPLEICLAVTTVSWCLAMMRTRTWSLRRGALFVPMMVFGAFCALGFAFGLASGGDRYSAIWEFRPLVLLPLVYILVTNLFTKKQHYNGVYWLVMIAVTTKSVIAIRHYHHLSVADRQGLESLVDHYAAVEMNALFVYALAVRVYRKSSFWKRALLPILAAPAIEAYFISQRRAAFVGLAVALGMLAVILYWKSRPRFWMVVPLVAIAMVGYLGAFWNSPSSVGFPAQAIKGVIAPNQVGEKDRSSDDYRKLESVDILATIKSKPVTGIGFGQKFYRPVPLPDISTFVLREYITHNSILWIWMKAGVGGFLAMLYMFALAVRLGTRAAMTLREDDYGAICFVAMAYVVMYAIFAYVDIGWDPQSMVMLGIAFATISNLERLCASEPPLPAGVEQPELVR